MSGEEEKKDLNTGMLGVFHDMELLYCILILKICTDKTRPLKVSEIATLTSRLLRRTKQNASGNNRSVSRRLLALEEIFSIIDKYESIYDILGSTLGNDSDMEDRDFSLYLMAKSLSSTFGGKLKRTTQGKMKQYYWEAFEPNPSQRKLPLPSKKDFPNAYEEQILAWLERSPEK